MTASSPITFPYPDPPAAQGSHQSLSTSVLQDEWLRALEKRQCHSSRLKPPCAGLKAKHVTLNKARGQETAPELCSAFRGRVTSSTGATDLLIPTKGPQKQATAPAPWLLLCPAPMAPKSLWKMHSKEQRTGGTFQDCSSFPRNNCYFCHCVTQGQSWSKAVFRKSHLHLCLPTATSVQ